MSYLNVTHQSVVISLYAHEMKATEKLCAIIDRIVSSLTNVRCVLSTVGCILIRLNFVRKGDIRGGQNHVFILIGLFIDSFIKLASFRDLELSRTPATAI